MVVGVAVFPRVVLFFSWSRSESDDVRVRLPLGPGWWTDTAAFKAAPGSRRGESVRAVYHLLTVTEFPDL